MKEIAKSGGGPLQHHQRWKTQLRADDGDRSVHEHELLCMTLELSGCHDHLDLSALAGMELVVRHLQLIEESKAAGGAAAHEGARFFVGYRRTGALVAPELGRHVANKLQEEVSVMKERRKHAEGGLARGPPAKGEKTTRRQPATGECHLLLSVTLVMACKNSKVTASVREGCSLSLVMGGTERIRGGLSRGCQQRAGRRR